MMTKKLTFLGIETSCDETAAAVIRENDNGTADILSNIVSSQIEEHKTMMIHTRHTIENMTPLVRRIRAIIQHIQRHLTAGRTQEGQNWINRFQVRFVHEFVQLGCVESWEEVHTLFPDLIF